MDPVAHTLVGAVLAETGLKRVSRYATATLLIGVNLPDIDGIASFWGRDVSLFFRRGWSHGIVAVIVLPLILAGMIWLWHRWRHRSVANPQFFRPGWIVLLSFIAVWSHPLLDWLNTYGVRLLMPFDGRWFYGDTLFIIDPWVWLVLAAGILLSRQANKTELAFWLVLAVLSSWLVLSADRVDSGVQVAWVIGITLIVLLHRNRSAKNPAHLYARISTVMLILYIGTVYGVARITENLMSERYGEPLQSQVNPLPGLPFSHRTILVYDDYYRIIGPDGQEYEVPREEPDEIVRTAMQSESIRGFVTWTRYPYWDVEETADEWRVRFWDLRYQGPGTIGAGIGYAEVDVPKTALSRLRTD